MKHKIFIALVLILALTLYLKMSYGVNIDYSPLDLKIKEIARKYNAVGLGVTIVRNGKIEWTTNYGFADRENVLPAERDTVYRIASISKPISNIVLLTLWDKGLIDIDKDIGSYLGFKVRNPNYPDKPITLRSIMTHTSSISDEGTYNRIVDSSAPYPPLKDILTPGASAYSANNFLKYAPGSGVFSYSNLGAGIMAAVVESVTGKRFSDYAREAVFQKMGIDASFLSNDISNINKIANLYSGGYLSYSKEASLKEKNRIGSIPVGQLYRLVQGNLYISSQDLAKLMIVLMGDGTYDGRRILSAKAVEMMNAVQWTGSSGTDKMWGLNLSITDDIVKGRRLRGHQGRSYGATSEMYYDISTKSGVVFLSNGSIEKTAPNGFSSIGSEILNAAFETINSGL